MPTSPYLSVVVPLYNEEESVCALVEAVSASLGETLSWELLLVDDGSRDRTVERAGELAARDPRVRLVELARNFGQTAAMQAGLDGSRGEIVVTMDGDLQNDPADIPKLVAKLQEGYGLVAGYRENRQDRVLTRKVPSWVANRIIRYITGVSIRDNGCSLKAFSRPVVDRLHLYSDMHRFIPAVAAATAGVRITEVPVRHHARRYGQSKYGLSRVLKVLGDLLAIHMIRSFRDRPLLLLAAMALIAGVIGLGFGAVAVVALVAFPEYKANAVVLPGAALIWFSLAGYLLLLGLIAEGALRAKWTAYVAKSPLIFEETQNALD